MGRYVVIECGERTHKSTIKSKTLSPVWNEEFELNVRQAMPSRESSRVESSRVESSRVESSRVESRSSSSAYPTPRLLPSTSSLVAV